MPRFGLMGRRSTYRRVWLAYKVLEMHSRKSQSHRTNIAERFRQGDNLIMCVRAQFRPASASTSCRSTREHQRVGSRAITLACPAHRRGGGGRVGAVQSLLLCACGPDRV